MAQWADEGTNMAVTSASLQYAVRNCLAYKFTAFEADLCTVQYAVASRVAYNFGYVPIVAGEEETSTVF